MKQFLLTTIVPLVRGSLRIIKGILSIIASIVLVSTVASIAIYGYFARDLPDIKSLEDYHPPIISEVFDDSGKRIGEFWTECRIFVPLENVPPQLAQAFVDSEDDRFYEHKGVDMRAVIRAFFANVKAGSVTQGGSTITQQITRSLLLSPERTMTRKIREAILATRLERFLSKKQILTLYLNQIFLGNRAYGVGAAARNYFHKDVNDLTLAEMALIAGLPTAPTSFSPVVSPENARRRQVHVLRRMLDQDHITEAEMNEALNEKLTIFVAGTDKQFIDKDAAYFIEYVRQQIKERYGDEALYHKGLKISTTVNMSMQRAATRAIQNGVARLDKRQGYRGPLAHGDKAEIQGNVQRITKALEREQHGNLLLWPPEMEHKRDRTVRLEADKLYEAVVTDITGKEVAIQIGPISGTIGHAGYKWARRFNTETFGYDDANYVSDPKSILDVGDLIEVRKRADGSFDLAQEPEVQGALFALDPHTGAIRALVGGTDFSKSEFNRATQALRQPGSSFKPFIYAAALDKGYTFETRIIDEPVTYQVGINQFWSPKNYGGGFKGATPFRNSLIYSRNIPTVKIAYDIGTHYLTAYVRKMGLTNPIDKYLSMALGANGVYLSEMVPAYAVFVNHGIYHPQVAITKVEDATGRILEEENTSVLPQTMMEAPDTGKPKEEEEKDSAEVLRQAVKKVEMADLNEELFAREQKTTEHDKLILTDLEIKTLYGKAIPPRHVMTPQTSQLMLELLQGVVKEGTGTYVRNLGKPAGGKTGTTNDETDAWFIGFVPDMVAGIWVGFDEIKPIGRGETGGRTAAPIFVEFMKAATDGKEAKTFEPPGDFPTGNISRLTGGSSLFGSMPKLGLPGEQGGSDRAGEFFDQDLERIEPETTEHHMEATSPSPKSREGEGYGF